MLGHFFPSVFVDDSHPRNSWISVGIAGKLPPGLATEDGGYPGTETSSCRGCLWDIYPGIGGFREVF